jgi:hypothetical protein
MRLAHSTRMPGWRGDAHLDDYRELLTFGTRT